MDRQILGYMDHTKEVASSSEFKLSITADIQLRIIKSQDNISVILIKDTKKIQFTLADWDRVLSSTKKASLAVALLEDNIELAD